MIPDISYSPALMVTAANTYKNAAFRSDTDFAVQINAGNQLIVFNTCIFVGAAECIVKGWGGARVRFLNCKFYGAPPLVQWSRAFNGYNVMQFEMINCYTEHTGGILIEQWAGDLNAPLIVQYNQFKNIDKRKADGTDGDHRANLMIKSTNAAGGLGNVDISWNESICIAGESGIEDHYNFMDARGAGNDKPIHIHDNYIFGAYPNPITSTTFSGSGITTDSGGTAKSLTDVTAFVLAENNIILECCNSGLNIATGHDIHLDRNLVMHSGFSPDGVTKLPSAWAGCAIFNSNLLDESVFINNTIQGNTLGVMHWGGNYPYKDRQDEMNNRGTGQWQNRMVAGGNTYLPDGSVTPATVAAQYPIWQKKQAANGIVIGPGGGVVAPTTYDVTIPTGKTGTGTLIATNKNGSVVPAQYLIIRLSSSDTTIVQASWDTTGKVTLTPNKAGTVTITIYITTLSGKVITKTKTVQVTANTPDVPVVDNEAVDFTITFSVS